MSLRDLVSLALARLGTGRLRTALTMLGIVIGVASVVALVSVAQGATSGINSRLEGLGTNLLTVNPGSTTTGATRGASGSATTLTIDDATALGTLAGVAGVAPQLSTSGLVVAGSLNETTTIIGTTPDYLLVRAYEMWQGSFLNATSAANGLRVAVLGATTADTLGLDASSIGTEITIKGIPFQVIGIMQAKGGTGFQSPDDEVLIPLSTARKLFIGSSSVQSIGISVASAPQMATVKVEIAAALEARHGIAASSTDDFTIQDQSQLLSTASSVSAFLTMLLAGIASISLIVGGIGIMNIMLVSVRERTREIGIRKAIGARGRDLLLQFLIEALVLSVVGGLIGIVVGIAVSLAVTWLAGWTIAFNPLTFAVPVVFSVVVGFIFGVWPAREAARLDPVIALRSE